MNKESLDVASSLIRALNEDTPQGFRKEDCLFCVDILRELTRAREKFPESEGSFTALVEEVGELAKAILDEPLRNVRAEAVQVAAMAIRVVLDGDSTLDKYREAKKLKRLASKWEFIDPQCEGVV